MGGEREGRDRRRNSEKSLMEWNSKPPTWDLTELNQEKDPYFPTLVGSGTLLGQKRKENFSVDLKLGRLGDLGDGSSEKFKDSKSLKDASSSGSSRRAKGLNGTQRASCLVDGCNADLSNCRDYHRRHHVCERHSKTPVVIVGGEEQRFCQQCSR